MWQNYDKAKDFAWPTNEVGVTIPLNGQSAAEKWTGISFQRSEVAVKNVSDGTSNTYLIGERFIDPEDYETGKDGGDNETWCTGFNNDNFRMGFDPPAQDRADLPYKVCQGNIFGSTHAAGWFCSFCDGHVELMSYDMDLPVHRGNANRADEGSPLATKPGCPSGGF